VSNETEAHSATVVDASGSGARILIMVGEAPRQILTISERGLSAGEDAGDLNLSMAPAINYRSAPDEIGTPTQDQKYSVHNSRGSAEGVNTLKLTHALENEEVITSVHSTKAIKAGKLAPIFVRAYPDLSADHYKEKRNKSKRARIFIDGPYSPPDFVLVLGAFVVKAGRTLAADATKDFTIENVQFTDFNISLVFWFLGPMPSIPIGLISHFFTEEPSKINDAGHLAFQNKLREGVDESDWEELFYLSCLGVRDRMCKLHQDAQGYLRTTQFFRRGVKKGNAWERYIDRSRI